MEDLLAILAKQSNVAGNSQAAGSPQVTPRHKSPSKYISRGRSVLSLANEWLKPKSGFIHREIPTEIPNKGSKGSLSQFFSLRGSREKKTKSSDPMIFRTRSCSPQKEIIVIDEYCTMRARRRKSLQDLLGTVTGKISRRHRDMTVENARKSCESIPRDRKGGQEITSFESDSVGAEDAHHSFIFASPKSATELPSALDAQHRPCRPIGEVEFGYGTSPQSVPATSPKDKTSFPTFATPTQKFDNTAQDHGEDKGTIQQPWASDSGHNSSMRPAGPTGMAPCPELGQQGHIPSLQSLGRKKSISPVGAVKYLSPGIPGYKQIRSEDDTPVQCEYNVDGTKTTEGIADIDPFFCSRAQNREVRYHLICGELHSPHVGQSDKEIEDQIKLTAAKMSKNLHFFAAQSTWSSDSSDKSDIEIDDKSIYSWDGNESENWAPVAAGQKIMSKGKLAPCLHVKPPDGVTLEFPGFEERCRDIQQEETKVKRDSHCTLPEFLRCPTITHDDPANMEQKHSVTAATYFQSFDMNSSDQIFALTRDTCTPVRQVPDFNMKACSASKCKTLELESLNLVVSKTRVKYNPRPMALRMEGTFSKDDAVGEYQSHNSSDHCLLDRNARTIFPQVKDRNLRSHLPTDSQGLELLWLPMQSFQNYCTPETRDQNPETVGNASFRKISPSEDLLTHYLTKACASPRICDQNMSLSNSDEYSDYRDGISPSEYSSSTTEPDLKDLGHPDIKLLVQKVLNTTSQEKDQANSVGMNNLYNITADDETVRRYIGSLFSSSNDSILTDQSTKLPVCNSAESIWSKIEDSRAEQAGRVKTWAELGKDFLDVYAPFDRINAEQRAQIAVHNALSIRGGLQNNFVDEIEFASSYNSDNNYALSEIDLHIGSQDKGSDSATTFHYANDIASKESAGKPSSQTEKIRNSIIDTFRGQGPEEVVLRTKSLEEKADLKGEKTISLWAESDIYDSDICLKEREPNIKLIKAGFPDDIKMNSRIGHSESTFAQIECNQLHTKSKIGIAPMLEDFSLLNEQSEDPEEKILNEANPFANAEPVALLSGPSYRGHTKAMRFLMDGERSEANVRYQKLNRLDPVMTGNEDSKLDVKSKQKLQQEPITALAGTEKTSGTPPPELPLADFNWKNSLTRIALLDSDSGIAQFPKPHFRNFSSTKVFSPDSPETCYAARISDAETEESEAFGVNLRRYGRLGDDDKENEEQWWRDLMLYG